MPPILAHVAPLGQLPGSTHARAQYFSPLEESCRRHWGFAFVPAGTSVGQLVPSHFGAQSSPLVPCTSASTSSLWHGGFS
jgi:hypothetical protein